MLGVERKRRMTRLSLIAGSSHSNPGHRSERRLQHTDTDFSLYLLKFFAFPKLFSPLFTAFKNSQDKLAFLLLFLCFLICIIPNINIYCRINCLTWFSNVCTYLFPCILVKIPLGAEIPEDSDSKAVKWFG